MYLKKIIKPIWLKLKTIKMLAYKGTEEQPSIQADDVYSLKYKTQIHRLHALERARNNDPTQ